MAVSGARKVGVNLSLDLALLSRLDEMASKAGLSRSELVRLALADYLGQLDSEADDESQVERGLARAVERRAAASKGEFLTLDELKARLGS